MALTKKLRRELLDMRIEAYRLTQTSLDIGIINAMSAVVEFADKARRQDSAYFADLAKKNFELGKNIIKQQVK